MITTQNCFEDEGFCCWWSVVEEENGNQFWDEGHLLEQLVYFYNTSFSPEFAYANINLNEESDDD
jgi:hypothetical protein